MTEQFIGLTCTDYLTSCVQCSGPCAAALITELRLCDTFKDSQFDIEYTIELLQNLYVTVIRDLHFFK